MAVRNCLHADLYGLLSFGNPSAFGQRKSLARVTSEIMLTGTRLVLTPAKRAATKQMNVTLEPDQYFTRPAGRGYLASMGVPALIQLATDQ